MSRINSFSLFSSNTLQNQRMVGYIFYHLFLFLPLLSVLFGMIVWLLFLKSLQHPSILDLNVLQLSFSEILIQTFIHPIFISRVSFVHRCRYFLQKKPILSFNFSIFVLQYHILFAIVEHKLVVLLTGSVWPCVSYAVVVSLKVFLCLSLTENLFA